MVEATARISVRVDTEVVDWFQVQVSDDENNFPYSNWIGPYRTPEGFEHVTAMYAESYVMNISKAAGALKNLSKG